MTSPMSLQRKLTLSHLSVVVVTALLITILTLAGYWVYTRTDYSASWVAETAYFHADDVAYAYDEYQGAFDEAFTQQYIETWFIVDPLGYEPLTEEDYTYEEWFAILEPDGTVLNSNYPENFIAGQLIFDADAPGIERLWPFTPPEFSISADDISYDAGYAKAGDNYVGLAPIISLDDQLLGYVYYRSDARQTNLILGQTARQMGWGMLGATAIAVLLSGVMGSQLARPISQRIARLSAASDAFAEGDFARRVEVDGEDEIGRLSAEFNQMADQIETQIDTVRDLTRLDERNRLARDLHDAIKQQLFGLNLTIGSVASIVEAKPDVAQKRLGQASDMTQRILEEMDAIIQQLRPASLEDRGLATAIQDLVDQWQGQTSIPVELNIVGERELPLQLEQGIYRITQEALNNIARHAEAQHVNLLLDYGLEKLQLVITDDGKGFDRSKTKATSHGLRNMEERSAELGGKLTFNSQLGKGTALQLRVPIADGFQ